MNTKMVSDSPFTRGFVCGMLMTIGANGFYWFISTSFDEASAFRVAGVTAQVVVCALAALWLYAREKRSARAALSTPAQAR